MINTDRYIEFYITNECNLACSNCNRFNNYEFSGHYYWEDHKDEYAKWAKRVTPSQLVLIGGEPTLHPELSKWAFGLRELWPNTEIMIQSNGINTEFRNKDSLWKHKIGFGISVHSDSVRKNLIKNWGRKNIATGEDTSGAILDQLEFTDAAIVNKNGVLTVHNSDPELAFSSCAMRHSLTMLRGKLYKCPAVAVLPEFIKQFPVQMSDTQRELLNSYIPLSPDCSDSELTSFLGAKEQYIPQCSLCPNDYKLQPITFHRYKKSDFK